ncbi:metallophosphoesterase family protein [Cytobacillus purgationiresistens]|uniref:DNA repair exonuclease SbcCD nuclease subunit n=1 Tax=Cytobacillus purgationiresistens TaxID=863449 RepID=A0ABU0ACG7_9BACI|nr:DNA repair exonuclease [Cytobacillus purgationiresistens]MDQ0268947.1 DNA repair exonuclease SbcCD nuclease subunit [Cytobacillus purgationiresistens]
MKNITFIHAADLHLDSPMIGLKHLPQSIFRKLQESTFESFSRIVKTAMIKKVDFVILAGDLFDAADRSIKAQTRFRKEMERLADADIQVFTVHGNHDHMGGEWAHLSLPDNVHIFSNEPEMLSFMKEDVKVHLYGFSYPTRHVHQRKIDHYKKVDGGDYHIGILHGNLEGSTDHGNYAPFSLSDLTSKGFDYWALGHIHKQVILNQSPPIIYPGNIQGRNRKETGKKGCFFVELSDAGQSFEFIETEAVMWTEATLDCSSIDSFQGIMTECLKLLEAVRYEGKGTLLILNIESVSLSPVEKKGLDNGDLLELLQEQEKDEESFVWVSDLRYSDKVKWNRAQLKKESEFYQEFFKQTDQRENYHQSLSQLYAHPIAYKYVENLTEKEIEKIVDDAETMLLNLLMKSEVKS